MKWNKTDLAMTEEGDLSVGIGGDLLLCSGITEFKQMLASRVKTIKGDLLMHPELGNVMQEFVGRRNTRETADEIKAALKSLLTYDGFVPAKDVTIQVVPVSNDMVMIHMVVENEIGSDHIQEFLFSYERGMETI